MKQFVIVCTLLFSTSLLAQQAGRRPAKFEQPQGEIISVNFKGNIFNAKADTVYIAQFINNQYVDYLSAPLDEKGNFAIEGSLPRQDFYVLRLGEERVNFVLRDGDDIQFYADGNNLNAFGNIIGSDESKRMKDFIMIMQSWQQRNNAMMEDLRNNPEKEMEIKANMNQEYSVFVANRRSYIAQNPKSPILLPALTSIDPDTEWATYKMVASQLEGSLPGSPTIENTYKQYLQLKKQKEAMDNLAPGKPAPDFAELTVNGDTMKLSDLRGQVVLLDFWASWCGPCRRENPNVVNLYKKYKDKGFTVMSVSLDQQRNKWLAAIEKDKLVWPNHVSDLKGWGSSAAKQYSVRGIPFTVLIDREGNIIKTKLRGAELEKELATLFD